MKLGVITASYPRFAGDPAGNFVAGHVAALRWLGHRVEVIAAGDAAAHVPGMYDDDAIRIPSGLFYRGGAPDALERQPIGTAAAAAAFTARLTVAVARRARHWDAIIAHWLTPSAIAALPSRLPLIAIAHGGDVFTLRRLHLLQPVLHALHARRARLVFVSEPLRAIARAAAPRLASWLDAALIQPMGIDTRRFAGTPRAPTEPPTILACARLVPLKGIDVAIAAMAQLRRPAQLVIAGDGPERLRLQALATATRCSFLGEVTTGRRDALLSSASIVVVPSRATPAGRTEGTPLIALEALAAGVPVVASATGGLASFPGLALVPPDDPRALAAAIDQLLAYPPAPLALRAHVAQLDWREVAVRLLRE